MKRRSQKLSLKLCMMVCMVLVLVNVNIAQDLNSAQDLNNAIKLSLSERYEDANEAFQKIIKNTPHNGDAYFYYGENVLNSYLADPFSSTLSDVCANTRDIFQKGLRADSLNMLNAIGLGMVVLLEKNDTSAADVYFNKAESVFPKNKKKYTEKHILMLVKLGTAQLYTRSPRFKKAIAYLERAKEVAPNNPDVANGLGDIHMSRNDASSAISNYNRALYLNPTSPVYQVKIGNIYMWARNLPEADNYFKAAKAIDSTFAPLYKGLGAMYYMGGQYKLSKENYKKFLTLSGNNTSAKISYANSLFRSRDYDAALTVIDEILSIDKSRPYLYRLAGYSSFDKKSADFPRALGYLETLFKTMPPDKIILKDYLYYGKTLINLKRDTVQIDKGLTMLLKAYQMDTTDNELLSNITTSAQTMKRYNIATALLSKIIAQGKATSNDYMNLGRIYYQTKQFGKADTIFTKLTQKEPNNVPAYLWIANTYFNMDPDSKLGIAKPKYEKVADMALKDTSKYLQELYSAYSYLGSYYLFGPKPEIDNAIKYFQKILKLNPNNKQWMVNAYFSLGIAHSDKRKKEYEKALEYYKKVLEIDPNNSNKDVIKKNIDDINKVLKSRQQQQ